jgi:hypothetical protein
MGRILLIIGLILCSTTSFEQVHEEYVEVVVSDSINIDPEIIDYTLMLPYYNEVSPIDSLTMQSNGNTALINEEGKKQAEKTNKEIRELILRLNIDTLESPINNTYSASVGYGNFILLRFKSKAVFNQFIKELKKYNPITGTITFLQNSQIEKYYPVLFKKIIEQANRNAFILSTLNNKKLGKIIQVKEEKIYGGWTSYPPLGALREYGNMNKENQIVLQKQFTIRYSWQ